MTKNICIITLCLFVFCACVESGSNSDSTKANSNLSTTESGTDNATVTETTISESTVLNDYEVSTFSAFVYVHKSQTGKILIYTNPVTVENTDPVEKKNFFPADSDLCQQATYDADTNPNGCKNDLTIEIPCEFQSLADTDDLLSINVSAGSETTDCAENIIIDLSQAEFSAVGLIFSSPITVFEDDFEFTITGDGFMDASDNTRLTFDSVDATLEDIYDKIVQKRTSN